MTATNRSLTAAARVAVRQDRRAREQIRAAHMAALARLLQKRRLQLTELPGGNFQLAADKGLLFKDGYWRWPERNLAGNAIDPAP